MAKNVSPPSKFRSPITNARWTRQLFYDLQVDIPLDQRVAEPLFTLHHDREGLINFRRAYVELGDPTGYQMAIRYLEDFSHWQLLMKAPWFRAAKEIWDEELSAKLSSEGLASIRLLSDGIEGVQPSVQLSAAKFLAGFAKASQRGSQTPKRGRPSSEEVAGELKRTAAEVATFADDAARIKLVKG